MKKKPTSLKLSLIGLALVCTGMSSSAVLASNTDKVLFGYYSDWSTYERNYQPANIPMTDLTYVLYAFGEIGNCAAPFATDAHPSVCHPGSYADGKQNYQLYSTDPYSDYAIIPTTLPSGRPTGYTIPNDWPYGKGNMIATVNLAHQSGKKALFSIGGYTLSVPFFTAMEPAQVNAFVGSILDFLGSVKADNKANNSQGFDGVDIDWEPNDNQWSFLNDTTKGAETLNNYLTFMTNLRLALDKKYTTYNGDMPVLTIALPASPTVIKKVEQLHPGFWKALSDQVDYMNIMAYDYHGAFDSPAITNFMAPLIYDANQPSNVTGRLDFNVTATIDSYLNAGVPANKVIMGFPSYGRATTGVAATSPSSYPAAMGLYQAFSGSPSGQYSDGTGVYNYSYIINTMLTPTGGYTGSYIAKLGTTAYNSSKQIFIAYDDVANIQEKTNFALEKQLGGMMEWELSGDLLPTDKNYNTLSLLHNAKLALQAGQ